jgi:hypothetical protein
MDEDTRRELTAIAGEAMFAAHLGATLATLLIERGLLGRDTVTEALDQVMLALERHDHLQLQKQAAMADARSRLLSLIGALPAPPGKA